MPLIVEKESRTPQARSAIGKVVYLYFGQVRRLVGISEIIRWNCM